MAYNIFGAVGITGDQPSTLNKIPTDVIKHDDFALVSSENKIYFYKLDAYSSLVENLPYVVKPIDITESTPADIARRRWILISQEYFNSNLLQTGDKSINTSKINALPGLPLEITTSNGMKIFYHTNGIVAFPNSIIIQPPTIGSHATTKTYVDEQIATVNSSLGSQNSTLRTYINSQDIILQNFLINLLNQEIATVNTSLDTHINDISVHYTILNFEITTWEEEAGLYYYDVVHNKNRTNVIYKFFQTNEEILPLKTEMIDSNTLRVWMPENGTITGILI